MTIEMIPQLTDRDQIEMHLHRNFQRLLTQAVKDPHCAAVIFAAVMTDKAATWEMLDLAADDREAEMRQRAEFADVPFRRVTMNTEEFTGHFYAWIDFETDVVFPVTGDELQKLVWEYLIDYSEFSDSVMEAAAAYLDSQAGREHGDSVRADWAAMKAEEAEMEAEEARLNQEALARTVAYFDGPPQ